MSAKKLEIFTTFKCNNDCVFCVQKENREKYKDLRIFKDKDDIREKLDFYNKKGYRYINFLGGEPFKEENFIDVLRVAKEKGFLTALATNGFYLGDAEYAKKALPLIDELIVSVYGHNQELISQQSRNKLLYLEFIKALNNINKYFKGQLLKVNCVINKLNYKYLLEIARFVKENGFKEINFTSMEIQDHNKDYAVDMTLIKPILQKVADYGNENSIVVRFSELPYCVLGDDYHLAEEMYETERDIFNNDELEVHGRIKVSINKCKTCSKNNICPGVDMKYIKKFGNKI